MGNEQGKMPGGPTPAGIQTMDETLQKKFAKGIQYNMKIVLRGDRNSGKTTLFHRMEGKPFNEAYIPTNEIQVTSILWSYKVTNDTVKVEIWDIVDKGRPQGKEKSKSKSGGLKMFNSTVGEEPDGEGEENGKAQTLDASFLDVYKGAHGVVFIFDIIKQWTWKYVEKELANVPLHVPIMILANFCDMQQHRTVSKEDCLMSINYLDRPEGAAEIRYAECSLKNGFGLMHLHKFLSIPFLQLQQETLLQQLQVNREQMMVAMEELNTAVETEDQDYSKYMAKLDRLAEEKKRKIMMARLQQEQEDQQSEANSTSSSSRQPHPSTPPTKPAATTHYSDAHRGGTQQQQEPQGQSAGPQRSNSLASKLSSRFSGLLGKGKEEDRSTEAQQEEGKGVRPSRPRVASKTNIEEFMPEGDGVDDFLSDEEEEEEEEEDSDDDDDSEAGNPMIAGDEDLSSPDEAPPPVVVVPPTKIKNTPPIIRANKQISFSDSEDEEATDVAPAILTPIKLPTPVLQPTKKSSKPLKSAKDIELTDSEEEDTDRPQIMADEDCDSVDKKEKKIRSKNPPDNIFEPSPVVPSKKKQSGLMLQFDPAITSARGSAALSAASASSKEVQNSPKDSPSTDSKCSERKKKKSKKSSSRHSKKEEAKKGQEPTASLESASHVTDDPFSAIASLDAWLNSTSGDVLTPTQAPGVVEVGAEEEPDEGDERVKKPKKHKHKKHREGTGEEEKNSSSKKKHRSHHHKSSHHRREQDD